MRMTLRMILVSKPSPLASAKTSFRSPAMAALSSSRRSMRSMKLFSRPCAVAFRTSGLESKEASSAIGLLRKNGLDAKQSDPDDKTAHPVQALDLSPQAVDKRVQHGARRSKKAAAEPRPS